MVVPGRVGAVSAANVAQMMSATEIVIDTHLPLMPCWIVAKLPKTISEVLFEQFLSDHSLPFERVVEADAPRPDYLVGCGMALGANGSLRQFEYLRRQIVQRRMQPLPVIHLFQKPADRSLGVGQIAIRPAIHLLALQRRHEALRHRVVPRTACPE